jgi:LuxR family transcriptional regulator, maltose regulon positive regulatory protein
LTEPHSTDSVSEPPPPQGVILDREQFDFLATKLVLPRCEGLIPRPRLLNMASQLSGKKLAVIKAPAGFGKTSLAAAWSQELQQRGNAVGWLTLDPDDDEPPTFIFYLCLALQRASKTVGADAIDLIREGCLRNPRAVLSTLVNDLADIDDEIYLTLEDYHWITNTEIHDALSFFLKHSPSHCHVVLTTRTEPPLPLILFRAQNILLEIDAPALRFDLQEMRHFIEVERPGTLSPSDVRLLHEKTEGWAAALRVVTSTSIQLNQDFGQYVRNLSGAQRPIGAYLKEMLDGLPRDMVQFMLRTAILDRFCAPLCEVVTGANSGQELLRSIEQRQLLLVPLDQAGKWYRYHSLLAEYLSLRLESELGNEILGLHQRASHWYAAQELWMEAVQHAFAAGDAVQALGWIKNCAMPLVKRGDLFTLLGWQRFFPAGVMRGQPEVGLAIAWGMALAAQYDESLALLGEIERDVNADHLQDQEAFRCEYDTIRSVALAMKDDSEAALPIAQDCLSRSTDPWTANVASNVVRFGHLKRGDFREFYATPWIPYSIDEDKKNVFASVYYRCLQGNAEAQQLRISSANRYYLEAQRLAEEYVGPNSVAAALPASLIARIRYEQGRLDEAESLLIYRIPLINAGALLDGVLSAYSVMARIAVHRMNVEWAHTLLEAAENQGEARGWGRLSAAAVLERARLFFNEGRIDEGAGCLRRLERLAAEYPAPANCAWSDIHRYAEFGRAYLASAEERFEDAISILNGLRQEFESVGNRHLALRAQTHAATVRFRAKQFAEALESFSDIVTVFARARIYQPVLDEGKEIGPLLAAFQDRVERAGGPRDLISYTSNLTAAWKSRYDAARQKAPASAVAEALTSRESDILRLIAEGLSNKEIAKGLAIAPETVKSHIKHIFTKLNVERRMQAVSRAQILGLTSIRR